MSEQRWTAPQAGWYRFGGAEPEFLGAERPADAEHDDNVQTFSDWVTEPYRPEVGGHASTAATINDLPPMPERLMRPEAGAAE